MNQHVSDTVPRDKKATLWTPWGSQRVPDLDRALEMPARRVAKRQLRTVKPKTTAEKPQVR